MTEIPKDHQLRVNKTGKQDGKSWSWEKRIAVATKYLALGNMRLVSELENIPYITLQSWKNEDWWPQILDEIRKAKAAQTNTKMSKIVDKSLDLIADRLENGDWVFDQKNSQMIRKEVSLKDATQAANALLNQQIKMEEMTQRVEIQKESVQDTLKMLAGEFAKWAKKDAKQEVIDVDFKEINNAIHAEREEGLPEGSGPLHEQAGSGEEEDTTKCSSP